MCSDRGFRFVVNFSNSLIFFFWIRVDLNGFEEDSFWVVVVVVVVVDLLCGGAQGVQIAPAHRHPHLQQNKKTRPPPLYTSYPMPVRDVSIDYLLLVILRCDRTLIRTFTHPIIHIYNNRNFKPITLLINYHAKKFIPLFHVKFYIVLFILCSRAKI